VDSFTCGAPAPRHQNAAVTVARPSPIPDQEQQRHRVLLGGGGTLTAPGAGASWPCSGRVDHAEAPGPHAHPADQLGSIERVRGHAHPSFSRRSTASAAFHSPASRRQTTARSRGGPA